MVFLFSFHGLNTVTQGKSQQTIEMMMSYNRYENLTRKWNELQTSYRSLTIEQHQLQTMHSILKMERDQLQKSYNNMVEDRGQLQKRLEDMTKNRDDLQRKSVGNYCYFTSIKTKQVLGGYFEVRHTCFFFLSTLINLLRFRKNIRKSKVQCIPNYILSKSWS